ncbi:hypothetical protein CMQ_1685 [Grosmannia clavigera kw1407]|uniref:COX assembly mitochondrial protein n=1 Tax=Grosmannia clavigera (strain kw1407 / UAMH 11150) TaxID=655863 RepID=F0XDG1_GROCL|nr:uncharacterized protein CMQ_1685 [Grosmannia clavigera kw1407]EFX04757.1 hypothetical protein CMQ_1685 [Grosmannia clavigera kw1407]
MAAMAVDPSSPAAPGGTGGTGDSDSTGSTATGQPQRRLAALPTANPIPLSASQEAQVRELYYDRVRQQCQAEIKAFAECALGRTFSVVFACREHNKAMNACLKGHATPAALDAAREEWFARRTERAAERQRKARRKAEQEKLLRAWWGLEGADGSAGVEDVQARRRRLEEEKMSRPERFGGFAAKDRPRFEEQPGEKR